MYDDRTTSEMEKKAQKTVGKTYLISELDSSMLETFDYDYPEREIVVEHETDEFTCVCPYSGLPDFARITIRYTPNQKCIELKSFKYYLYAYRQIKIFNEHVVNSILNDLVKVLDPLKMEIIGEFTARGGMFNKVTAYYSK